VDDPARRSFAGLVAVSLDWCWDRFLALGTPELEWALDELAKWVQPNDNAPNYVRSRTENG
jgi:hypothetical protein